MQNFYTPNFFSSPTKILNNKIGQNKQNNFKDENHIPK